MAEEVLITDGSNPRLALTPDRMIIKFPEIFEDKARIVEFAKRIREKLQGQLKFGLRGQFFKPYGCDFYKIILMAKEKRGNSHNCSFKEGEDMEFILPEIIIKDVTQPKLTLTPNRMTIKFPEIFEDKDRIVEFANQIKEHLGGKVEQSLRGRFLLDNGIYSIALQIKGKDSGNETIYNFREGEL